MISPPHKQEKFRQQTLGERLSANLDSSGRVAWQIPRQTRQTSRQIRQTTPTSVESPKEVALTERPNCLVPSVVSKWLI